MNAGIDSLVIRCSELIKENKELYKRRGEALGTGLKYREENWLLNDSLLEAAKIVRELSQSCPGELYKDRYECPKGPSCSINGCLN